MREAKKNSSNCEDGKLFFANYPSYLCLLLLFLMIYQYHDVLLLLSIISLINFYSLTYLFYCAATNPTNKNPIPYSNCSNKPQTSIFGNFDENMLSMVYLFHMIGKNIWVFHKNRNLTAFVSEGDFKEIKPPFQMNPAHTSVIL